MPFHEQNRRSLVKAITFRAVILFSDIAVIYFVTRRVDTTLTVVVASNLASTVLYYLHERAWNQVHWGKVRRHSQPHRRRHTHR